MSNFDGGSIGCLAAIGLAFLGLGQCMHWEAESGDKEAVRVSEALIKKSQTTRPNAYFDEMKSVFNQFNELHRFDMTEGLGCARDLVVNAGTGAAYNVSVDSCISSNKYDDLGEQARESAVNLLSVLVWLSGEHAKSVHEYRVTLTDTDGKKFAYYEATLAPDSSLFQHWARYDDPKLRKLVSTKTDVVADDASGLHWVTCTGRCKDH